MLENEMCIKLFLFLDIVQAQAKYKIAIVYTCSVDLQFFGYIETGPNTDNQISGCLDKNGKT